MFVHAPVAVELPAVERALQLVAVDRAAVREVRAEVRAERVLQVERRRPCRATARARGSSTRSGVTSPGARSSGNATWNQPNGVGNGKRREAMAPILEHVPFLAPVEPGLASGGMAGSWAASAPRSSSRTTGCGSGCSSSAPGERSAVHQPRPRPPADPGEGRPHRGRSRARHAEPVPRLLRGRRDPGHGHVRARRAASRPRSTPAPSRTTRSSSS